tara:strand:+ start:44 stop:526 length:483 start_codon:yes stop_codon:yes gene_type:complete
MPNIISDEERAFMKLEAASTRAFLEQQYKRQNNEILAIGSVIILLLAVRATLAWLNADTYAFGLISLGADGNYMILSRSLISVSFVCLYLLLLKLIYIHIVSIAAITTTAVLLWQDLMWIIWLLENPPGLILSINLGIRILIIGLMLLVQYKLMRRDLWL